MTIQQLRYIVTLEKERHFARAAEKCLVTQPGLTIQLKKLEEEIGIKIFDRSKVPLEPTLLGLEIIEKAKRILREVDTVRDFVIEQKNILSGKVHLGVVSTLSPYLIPLCLREFQKTLPEVEFIISEDSTVGLMKTLETGELDVALMATPTGNPSLREFPIFDEPFMAYLPLGHKSSEQDSYELDDQDRANLLILEGEFCYNSQLLDICSLDTSNSFHNFSYEINSIETLKNMVRQGFGFAIVPLLSTIGQNGETKARSIPFSAPQPAREISLVTSDTFSKKLLVEKMSQAIWTSLPDSFKGNTTYKKVRWDDSPYFSKKIKQ
ncbi:hydrogen peroxide-inducible genes activator [Flagellimonas hadalis]|uniref:Hydrogen peroxide-inducible genes activator n=1 Tax=Flagellimonas hadalis TaxID=2597517 RepID=A0A5N5ISA6_9FLAO|nr:hydrogen peroxide-inducible genes activator [Allomuricauda hadalis]KAB5491432.1 hydrogen peroxide-inducible genes activator [Allomuricauda hadalis]